MENKEQVYSTDGEFYNDFCSINDDLKEYHDIGESVVIWEADKKEWKHSDFINVDDLFDSMQTCAMDECGEVAKEYLNELNEMQKLDLHICIAKWFNKNAKLDFYGVENEHKIMVEV